MTEITESHLNSATPAQMARANAAVEANLNEDGSPKYGSAQGYACALSAIIASAASMEHPEKWEPEPVALRTRDLGWDLQSEELQEEIARQKKRVGRLWAFVDKMRRNTEAMMSKRY